MLIKFFPLINTKYTSIIEKQEINSFGAIKTIEIDYPYKIRKNFGKLIGTIREKLIFAYLSLQKVFKSNFKSFGEYLFNELYDIINIEIDKQNKTKLLGAVHFSVTLRSNMMFRYFLDQDNLEIIIDYFKHNQSLEYSPIEMLASVLSEEAIHTLNSLIKVEEGSFYHIDSSDYVSQEQNIKFWASESLLVGNKELTTFPILITDKYIIELGCPKELEKEFKTVFKMAKESLSEKFKENIKLYMQHAKELTKIPKPTLKKPLNLKIAEWLGTFSGNLTGNAIIEIIKDGH